MSGAPGPVRTVIEASGAPQMHRDAIADAAGRAATYAVHACDYAEMRDDRALRRAVVMLSLCAAAAADGLSGLRAAVEASENLARAAGAAQPDKRACGQTGGGA